MKIGERESAKLLAALDNVGELPDYGQRTIILHAVSKKKWGDARLFEISIIRKTDKESSNEIY